MSTTPNLLRYNVGQSLPTTIVVASFFHSRETLPYNEIETWCNRQIPVTKKGFIRRAVANDLIMSIMTAWDIVGRRSDYVKLASWTYENKWSLVSKPTKISLQPLIHPIAEVNVEESSNEGQQQDRNSTLILSTIKASNFVFGG